METLQILKRPLTDAELTQIVERTIEERSHVGSSVLYKADADKVKESLRKFDEDGRMRVFCIEDDVKTEIIGILVFDVGEAWWTRSRILSEVFVFCVDPNFIGFGRIAIRELKALASIFNCDLIVAGNFFMDKPEVMTNSYRKGGFEISCPSYIKVVGGSRNG